MPPLTLTPMLYGMRTMFDVELNNISVEVPAPRSESKNLFRISKFEIKTGEHVHIHGPSGSGKTTLLHLLSGLFVPPQGLIKIGSTRFDHLSDGARAQFRRHHIGVIFQKLNLLEYLTVEENVRLGLPDLNQDQHVVRSALHRVGLEDRAQDLSSVLSLGEQQRVAVARILAMRPDIILADEPTSSLDQENATQVIDALIECAHGKTLVVVSHDQRLRGRFARTIDFRDLVSP